MPNIINRRDLTTLKYSTEFFWWHHLFVRYNGHIQPKMTANCLPETCLISIKWWVGKQRETMATIWSYFGSCSASSTHTPQVADSYMDSRNYFLYHHP